MNIKILNEKNELNQEIQNLYEKVFLKHFPVPDSRIWYKEDPLGLVKEFSALQDQKLISYNCFYPQKHKNYRILLSSGSMVNPEYKGSFIPFFGTIQDILKNQKYDLLYGFCNKVSFPLFTSKFLFNWQENKNYKQVNLLSIKKEVRSSKNISLFECGKENIEVKSQQISFLSRNEKWLIWRLRKPGNKYFVLKLNENYIIYKRFGSSVDLISILNCDNATEYTEIVVNLYHYIRSRECYGSINMIISTKELDNEIKRRFKFEIDPYERHLCYRILNKDCKINEDEMFFEMIDLDVF